MKIILTFLLLLGSLWAQQGSCSIYIASATDPVEAMVALKFAQIASGDVFYDLGSGDGVFVIAAAKLGAKAIGIEIQPSSVGAARKNAAGTSAAFILGDIFVVPYKDATIVAINLGCGPDNRKAITRTCQIAPKARILTPIDADLPDARLVKRSPAGRGWSIYQCGR